MVNNNVIVFLLDTMYITSYTQNIKLITHCQGLPTDTRAAGVISSCTGDMNL